MRMLKFVLSTLFLCAISLSAQTVDEIIAKNIQAHGGLAKLKAIQSMRVTGKFFIGEAQATFIQVYKRPLKVRLDATLQGMTVTQAYDGQNGWQIIPFTGKLTPEVMTAEELKRIQEEADFDGPLLDYQQKGNTVQLIGKENTDGADAYHIKVTLKGGEIRDLFINTNSFLATKMVGKTTVEGNDVELETRFSDFRDVQGVKLPFSIEQHSPAGQLPSQRVVFEKVEMNATVEDSVFKMPATPAKVPAAPAKPPQK